MEPEETKEQSLELDQDLKINGEDIEYRKGGE